MGAAGSGTGALGARNGSSVMVRERCTISADSGVERRSGFLHPATRGACPQRRVPAGAHPALCYCPVPSWAPDGGLDRDRPTHRRSRRPAAAPRPRRPARRPPRAPCRGRGRRPVQRRPGHRPGRLRGARRPRPGSTTSSPRSTRVTSTGCSIARSSSTRSSPSRPTGWPTTGTHRGSSSRRARTAPPSPSRIRPAWIPGSCARRVARTPRAGSGSPSSPVATARTRLAEPISGRA